MEQHFPNSSLTGLRIIIGQTASGKNALAFQIASRNDYEIISVDSMKIYRGMDIGTSKAKRSPSGTSEVPSNDGTCQKEVKYHLIDIVNPWESYNVAQFVSDCDKAIADIAERGRKPLLVCGTPLYLKALLYGIFGDLGSNSEIRAELESIAYEKGLSSLYEQLVKVDPDKAAKIHSNDRKRIIRALEVYRLTGQPISALQTHFGSSELRYPVRMAGLRWKSEDLYKRIDERVERMFQSGLVEEVRGLKDLGKQAREAIGYKEVIEYLNGKITLDEAKEQVKKGTRYLARKQMTWFRRFPGIKWIDCRPGDTADKMYKPAIKALE
ncbi:MAG: tRNA (adenosine(37)-N6)-dimethylallyltransferase MiaA [Planctomycetota bacterium]